MIQQVSPHLHRFLIVATVCVAACASRDGPGGHAHGYGKHVDRHAMDHHFQSPEQFAKEWNDPARDAWQKPQEIVGALALGPGATVADLGAGTGYLLEPLAAAVGDGGRVVALDVEPAMVEFLKKRREDAEWSNVEVRKSAYDDPKLAPESVDAVVTLNTWHHVDDRVQFASKLLAALKEGGRFVVVDFLAEPTEGRGPPLEMRLSAGTVAQELQAAGFATEIVKETLPRHYIVVATRPTR